MKKNVKLLFTLSIVFLVFSCSSALKWRAPEPFEEYNSPLMTFEQDAIKLQVKADSQLNLFEGKSYPLHVCVYQLRDPNAFNQVANNINTIQELLHEECSFSGTSVIGSRPLTVRPGQQNLVFAMDRAEGTRFIAIVAGYYFSLQKERVVRLIEVPVLVAKQSQGCFTSTLISKPGPLNIRLTLGSQQIENVEF